MTTNAPAALTDLDIMMGASNATKPARPKKIGSSAKRQVIAKAELDSTLVVECQFSGPDYWHFANIVRGTECVIGFGAKSRQMSYAVQIRDGVLTLYRYDGEVAFSGAL